MDSTLRNDPEKIGDFLVRIGVMQPWQLDDVLWAQHSGDARLFGEIAIERGYIEDAALRLYVESHSKSGETAHGKPSGNTACAT